MMMAQKAGMVVWVPRFVNHAFAREGGAWGEFKKWVQEKGMEREGGKEGRREGGKG
jgi:hypothetical protein